MKTITLDQVKQAISNGFTVQCYHSGTTANDKAIEIAESTAFDGIHAATDEEISEAIQDCTEMYEPEELNICAILSRIGELKADFGPYEDISVTVNLRN